MEKKEAEVALHPGRPIDLGHVSFQVDGLRALSSDVNLVDLGAGGVLQGKDLL